MRLEVLLSCMNQADTSIVNASRITGDVLIINQCQETRTETITESTRQIRIFSTTERGLSRSRNLALRHAKGDICLLCDDDETFVSGYEKQILHAFEKLPSADVIAFSITNQPCRLKKRIQRLSYLDLLKIKSWQIAFRRKSIVENGIQFDEYMGAGSGNGAQEENKFLIDCYKKKLTIYYVPVSIASVAQEQSTWFQGFTGDFFYKRGIATRYMMGLPLSIFYAIYYVLAKYPLYCRDISMSRAAFCSMHGILRNDIARQKRQKQMKERNSI